MVSLVSEVPSRSAKDEQFIRLFQTHRADLARYIASLTFNRSWVDDIVQDMAVALWKKFHEFDPNRPFLPWACRFAYFEVLKHREKMAKHAHVGADEQLENLAAQSGDQELVEARRRALDQCLDELPPQDRELLELRYASSETIQSLSKRTGISVHRLYHSLRRIRDDLTKSVQRVLLDDGWETV